MEIFVRCLTGKTITISMNSYDTIRSLQRQIEAKMGPIAWSGLRLLFGGKQLNADSKVSDYKILPSSTIDMVFRFPGGGGSRPPQDKHPLGYYNIDDGSTLYLGPVHTRV